LAVGLVGEGVQPSGAIVAVISLQAVGTGQAVQPVLAVAEGVAAAVPTGADGFRPTGVVVAVVDVAAVGIGQFGAIAGRVVLVITIWEFGFWIWVRRLRPS
jgi:hypothetical protein